MQAESLDQEDPLEKEMATHSSIPAWEIPWTEEPGRLGLLLLLLSRFSPVRLCATGSPPGSLIPGILQARTLDWGAISFSNA